MVVTGVGHRDTSKVRANSQADHPLQGDGAALVKKSPHRSHGCKNIRLDADRMDTTCHFMEHLTKEDVPVRNALWLWL